MLLSLIPSTPRFIFIAHAVIQSGVMGKMGGWVMQHVSVRFDSIHAWFRRRSICNKNVNNVS